MFLLLALKVIASLGGLEPPTFRLTAERANRLRHRDIWVCNMYVFQKYLFFLVTGLRYFKEQVELRFFSNFING